MEPVPDPSAAPQEPAVSADRPAAVKYLTFRLADQRFGLEVLRVREIVGSLPVTRVPGAPDCVRGVINLRGRVVPVIDLRRRLGMPAREDTDRTCIIVIPVIEAARPAQMGLIVDEVSDVQPIDEDQTGASAPPGSTLNPGLILGLGRLGDESVVLLDIDAVFSVGGLSPLSGIAGS